jgi:capsid protein
MLQAITAAWGLPMEFVQHRLTKSNMASARAALMQAYRTFQTLQESIISHVEQPFAQSVIIEDIARGRLSFSMADPELFSLRFNRPPKQFPDPLKEWNGNMVAAGTGKSPSTFFGEQGLDFQDEVMQSHSDRAFAAAHGVPLNFGQPMAQTYGSPSAGDDSQSAGDDSQVDADDATAKPNQGAVA